MQASERLKAGNVVGIVELKDATEAERAIKEVNITNYLFKTKWLWENIDALSRFYKLAQEIKKRKGILPLTTNEVSELDMFGQYITNAYELLILKKHHPIT